MKIAVGVEMLELEMNFAGTPSAIHPTVIYDEDHAILVDTGMPGHQEAIRAAMEQAGIPWQHLSAVILTHQDIDHIGSIRDVLGAATKPLNVYAHADDMPYIEGDLPPIKMNPERVQQMLARLPEEVREQVASVFLNPPTAKVTKTVVDGEMLPFCGGIEVIFTPGHTPGHISLYHRPTKTLITGDATVSENGKVLGPNPHATPDMEQALASLKKFTNFDIQSMICYHGGLCDKNVNEQLRELTK